MSKADFEKAKMEMGKLKTLKAKLVQEEKNTALDKLQKSSTNASIQKRCNCYFAKLD